MEKRQTFAIYTLSSLFMDILISFICILFISWCLIGLDTVILWQGLYIRNSFSHYFLGLLCLQKKFQLRYDLLITPKNNNIFRLRGNYLICTWYLSFYRLILYSISLYISLLNVVEINVFKQYWINHSLIQTEE